MNTQASTKHEADALPLQQFDESIGIDDAKPFPSWEPSPSQIREWSAVIRGEREDAKAETPPAGLLSLSQRF
jgi:hypothetical protein